MLFVSHILPRTLQVNILVLPTTALLVGTFAFVEPIIIVILTVPLVYVVGHDAYPMLCNQLCKCSYLSKTPSAVIGCRYICGVTLSVSFNTVAGDMAPLTRRTMFLSRYLTTNDLGAALGPVICYTIAPSLGLTLLFTAACAYLLVVALLYTATFRKQQNRHHKQ